MSFFFSGKIKFLCVLSCLQIVACASNDYCEPVPDNSADAPEIIELEELNSKQLASLSHVNSVGNDPWLVVTQLEFEDSDGDLGAGQVSVSLNGKETYRLDMSTLFAQRGLPLASRTGRIALPFRLVPVNPNVAGKALMRVGVVLIDGAGNISNCQSLEIAMDYENRGN